MSRRRQIERRVAALTEIGDIMAAMKNIAVIETHNLGRYLNHQHRVLAGVEAAAADFLSHHPAYAVAPDTTDIVVAIGSQRGFCGDFNDSVLRALQEHLRRTDSAKAKALVVGRRLGTRLAGSLLSAEILDGPSVAAEVAPVMGHLMDGLVRLQASDRTATPRAITVFAHCEGQYDPRAHTILPAPPVGGLRNVPYPPLLNLQPQEVFSELAHHYLWAQMHDLFYGSLMEENRRRLQHLEGAIQRMDDKIVNLRRRCNGLRQEEITEEIEVILLSIGSPSRNRSRAGGTS